MNGQRPLCRSVRRLHDEPSGCRKRQRQGPRIRTRGSACVMHDSRCMQAGMQLDAWAWAGQLDDTVNRAACGRSVVRECCFFGGRETPSFQRCMVRKLSNKRVPCFWSRLCNVSLCPVRGRLSSRRGRAAAEWRGALGRRAVPTAPSSWCPYICRACICLSGTVTRFEWLSVWLHFTGLMADGAGCPKRGRALWGGTPCASTGSGLSSCYA